MVADKGLYTSDNTAACFLDENGFIFSQTVLGADKVLKLGKGLGWLPGRLGLPFQGLQYAKDMRVFLLV
ncbi:MAG: hypothetical protein FWF91_01025 [Coriobacteriia bacterium]|nr:hypothetical protein [Coriobacteriia bacterium]